MRTPAREKIKRALAARGMVLEDLAREVGLKPSSLTNILNGSARSRISQRAITNFVGSKIWPGVEVTEKVISLPAGAGIIFTDDDSAKRFKQDAGASCSFSANVATLQCSAAIHLSLSQSKNFLPLGSEIIPLVKE